MENVVMRLLTDRHFTDMTTYRQTTHRQYVSFRQLTDNDNSSTGINLKISHRQDNSPKGIGCHIFRQLIDSITGRLGQLTDSYKYVVK